MVACRWLCARTSRAVLWSRVWTHDLPLDCAPPTGFRARSAVTRTGGEDGLYLGSPRGSCRLDGELPAGEIARPQRPSSTSVRRRRLRKRLRRRRTAVTATRITPPNDAKRTTDRVAAEEWI